MGGPFPVLNMTHGRKAELFSLDQSERISQLDHDAAPDAELDILNNTGDGGRNLLWRGRQTDPDPLYFCRRRLPSDAGRERHQR
ncbi:hypothetical protein Poly21_09580 [Allorhodopirellula heiligendammensis]|uniref:Uncharacterized protein n=1 Tax=Allorhodopirellula heiligendammensis TaxID=2714739 RepID=A0A5C6C3X9_9BACT|nr:hypothetical protein Poly21_09580 [Allorhodopirellula heiligendammensis]